MEFSNLLEENKKMFDAWLNDVTLNEMFNGNVEDLQREFLKCVQNSIGSNFIIMTNEQLNNKLNSYHCSMEGYEG